MDLLVNLTTIQDQTLEGAVLRFSPNLLIKDGAVSLQYQIFASESQAAEGKKPGIIGYREVEGIVDSESWPDLEAKGAREVSRKEVPGPREGDEPLVKITYRVSADKVESVFDGKRHQFVTSKDYAIAGEVPSGKPAGKPVESGTVTFPAGPLAGQVLNAVAELLLANLDKVRDPEAEEWEKDKMLATRWAPGEAKK